MSDTDTNTDQNKDQNSADNQDSNVATEAKTAASEELKAAQQTDAEGQETAEPEKDPLDEWREKVTYLAAEMENMKKRFVRERGELIKMANEELIKGILPVFDNLDLALKSIRDSEKKEEAKGEGDGIVANLLKGVDMTLVHFQQTLDRLGVKTVESEGKPFDPSMHEAMGQSADENFDDGVVTSEFQKGFTLHGRVIRPARVIVNKVTKA